MTVKYCNHCECADEPVEIGSYERCHHCGSDDLVTACMECENEPAQCDDYCVNCTVAWHIDNRSEFDELDAAWRSFAAWRLALVRIQAALELRGTIVDIARAGGGL